MVEYYFQDQLRWSFGFENPNKAAALIAALLPFVWVVARTGWEIEGRKAKWLLVLLGNGLLGTGWWLLFMTYSRGGIVAAAAGFLYIGWREWKVPAARKSGARRVLALAMVLGILALFAGTDAAKRSTQWMAKPEGSVENRIELWKGGLRMIAQIPQGVGRGKSGSVYEEWFQPLESTERYRTLVNSYLTFAAEQGVWLFGLAVFVGALFWKGTDGVAAGPLSRGLAAGCRASIVAFAVAGIFSTTMEDWRVWVPPSAAAIFLAAIGWRARRERSEHGQRRRFLRLAVEAAAISAGVCAIMVASGWAMARKAPVSVAFHQGEMRITPEPEKPGRHYLVMVDEQVLGEDYGKLLRRWASDLHSTLRVRNAEARPPDAVLKGETLVAAGEAVSRLPAQYGRLVLIAPARLEPEMAGRLLRKAKSTFLLTPSFDEDGRASFWKEMAENAGDSRIRQSELAGVGTEVSWAWKQILDAMNAKQG